MIRYYILLLVWSYSASLFGQSDRLSQLSALYDDGEMYSPYVFSGFLEKSLPIQMVFGVHQSDVRGYIYYGTDADRYQIEGSITKEGELDLYEFDTDHRATGKIEGNLRDGTEQFSWYTIDRSRQLSMILHPSEKPHRIQLYTSPGQRPVILRNSMQQISSSLYSDTDVRWIDYLCEGIDCYESRPNTMMHNPLEFVYNDIHGQPELKFYPDHQYQLQLEGKLGLLSRHEFDSYESYAYPVIGDATFDNWVSELFDLSTSTDSDESYSDISDRLSSSTQGDFFITLWSPDIISGYLYKQTTQDNKVITLPFIFDIKKSKFYQVNDLFKKNFDYHFFIESYVTDEKRKSIISEHRIVKKLLKQQKYKHFALTPEGLLFFTDFSTIYGRRYILIPYTELRSALNNKTLENYIKKNSK